MKVENLFSAAAQRNQTLSDMLSSGGTVRDLFSAQEAILRKNQSVTPMQSPEDFLEVCRSYLRERMGAEAERALPVLQTGVLHTADHHGGLYSPQSFQGDLLLGAFLRHMGDCSGFIPVFSFSQVPLGNATHARGILCFPDMRGACDIPLYGRKQDNQMVFCTRGYDAERIQWASDRARECLPEGRTRETVLRLLREVYDSPAARNRERYADQVFFLGLELSRRLFAAQSQLLYIEAEEILRNLLPLDLSNPESLLYRVVTEGSIRRAMNETPLENNVPVSAGLFCAADRKGRLIRLNLDADGVLRGRDLRGAEIEFPANPERLSGEIAQRHLIPTGPTAALTLGWARGLTWFGGVFQSQYLTEWRRAFAETLERAGFPSLSEAVRPWDCSGYLSGPVFVLSPVEGGAVHAGPVEFLSCPERAWRLAADWTNLSLRDGHIMGMFEFYHDLVPPNERQEGWYGEIAAYVGTRFAERVL